MCYDSCIIKTDLQFRVKANFPKVCKVQKKYRRFFTTSSISLPLLFFLLKSLKRLSVFCCPLPFYLGARGLFLSDFCVFFFVTFNLLFTIINLYNFGKMCFLLLF